MDWEKPEKKNLVFVVMVHYKWEDEDQGIE
jgi:hypothetical protein